MKIKLSDKAKIQLKESVRFYEKRLKGLGRKFKNSLDNKVQFIAENPLASEIKYDEVQVTFLKTFPFTIHYTFENKGNIIFISAIFHTSQNPEKIKSQ